jgi:acyl transferase domain-containing protein/acyl carrier protein/SAM-dependent methyltransferase
MIRYADRVRPPARTLAAPVLADAVMAIVGDVLGHAVDDRFGDRSFADLGLGSLLAVRLIDRINRRYGLTLGIETLFECPTPATLVARLAGLELVRGDLKRGSDPRPSWAGVSGVPIPETAAKGALARVLVRPDTPGHDEQVRPGRDGGAQPGHDGAARPGHDSSPTETAPGVAGGVPVAVIGLSGRFGSTGSIAAFWDAVRAGRSLVGPLPRDRRRLVGGRGAGVVGGFLDGIALFDAGLFGLSPREARATDPQQRLFLEQAWLALENAGYPARRISGRRVGVYVGASASGYEKLLEADGAAADAWGMTGNLTALLASRISYHLDLRGPALTVDTACSSSLVALDLACQGIARGDCEMALVGGVGLFIDPDAFGLMRQAGMLSPAGRCATFDAAADGIAIGEAVVAVLLKPLDRALTDRDRIDAVVLATATNQDGRSNGITAPNSRAQAEVIQLAMQRAGIDTGGIDLIEAHGTGTPLGDPVEIAGLAAALAGRRQDKPVWLGSAKANLGHSSEAAGLVGLVKAVASLRHGEIPALAGFRTLNPRIELAGKGLAVADAAVPWPRAAGRVRRVGISSFGLAGTNAHAVVEEGRPNASPDGEAGPWPFLLSAETDALLAERAAGLAAWLRGDGASVPLAGIAATLARGRTHFSRRAALVAGDRVELLDGFDAMARGSAVSAPKSGPCADAAARYVSGQDDAWDDSATIGFAAIDLPEQPLQRASHWPAGALAPDTGAETVIALSPDDPMIGDHRIGGAAVLHAAALLHLALDAVEMPTLTEVRWLRPLTVPEGGASLRFSAPSGDGRISVLDGGGRDIASFRPETLAAASPPDMVTVLAMQAAAETIVAGGIAEPAPGVLLGPCYRGFDRLALGRDGAVGTVMLGPGVPARLRLLDAAIQAAAAVAGAGDGAVLRPRMPVSLASLVRHGEPGVGTMHLLARRGAVTGAETVVDIDVLSSAGIPLLSLTGLALREMAAAAAPAPAVDPAARTMRLVWTEAGTLARSAIAPRPTLVVAAADDGLADRLAEALAGSGPVARIASDAVVGAAAWVSASSSPVRVLLLPPRTTDMADPIAVQSAVDAGARLILSIARAIEPAGRDLDMIAVSRGAYAVGPSDQRGDPAQAAILGLAKVVFGREVPGASARLFDLAAHEGDSIDAAALLADPGAWTGEPVAIRAGQRFERRLEPVSLQAATAAPVRRVLIAGGFGRLGRAVARHAAMRWRAQVILVGRKPIDDARAAFLDELRGLGVAADGVVADVTTADGARAAFAAAGGPVDVVVQAVVDPVFGRASTVRETEFLASLRPKVAGLVALQGAASTAGAGRLVVFSSIGAFAGFPGAAGQSAYAAQCAFEDAFGESADPPVLAVHWGLWADPAWRVDLLAQVKAEGTFPMPSDACLDALDAMLADGGRQYVHAALSDQVWRAMGAAAISGPTAAAITVATEIAAGLTSPDPAQHALVERHALSLLAAGLADAGVIGAPGSHEAVEDVTGRLTTLPRLAGLAHAVVGLLADAGALRRAGGEVHWLSPPAVDPALAAAVRALGSGAGAAADLLDHCVAALPAVLRGELPATQVLFPRGSMERVEPIYRDQPGLEAANRIVAEAVTALAASRSGLAVIEIGAGTGATTAAILDRLGDDAPTPDRYLYTDVSAGFLQHGRAHYRRPWLDYGVLDIERDPGTQGLSAAFDVAVASNVLHATAGIDATLAHAASLLRPGGLLIVNENVRLEAFATLTFGLLDGWWRAEDPARRLAGGPLLDRARWRVALRRAGLDPVAELAPGGADASQVVILAVKPGASPVGATRSVVATRVRPAPAAESGGVTERVRLIVARALEIAPGDIDPERPFAEYGVDSIISPQIADEIADGFGIAFRSTDLFSYATIAALAAHVSGLLPVAADDQPPSASVSSLTASIPATAAKSALAHVLARPDALDHDVGVQPGHDSDHPKHSLAPADYGQRIAIVGMAGRFPGAPDLATFWANIAAGRTAIREIDRFPVPRTYDPGTGTPIPINARWAGLIEDFDHFDPLFFHITPAEAETMDPQQRLLLEEAWRALEDAGIVPARLAASRTGVFVGASANSYVAPGAPSLQTLGGSMAILSARLAYLLDLKGPTFPVDTGCSSSLVALHLACRSLATGECDLAVAGGVAINLLSEDILAYLSDAGMASPSGVCRTFDDGADGFVPGEGVGVTVLKRLEDAERDGDRIRAVILATGINQDGRTSGITAPSAAAQTALEVEVWQRAGIDPSTIRLVEAHGTGTRLGDPIEVNALTDAFRRFTGRTGFCAIGSVKTNIGHAMAAAGTAGLFKAVLALEHAVIPPTLNFSTPNRHIDFAGSPFRVATEVAPWPADGARRAVVSSFGFSGSNAHVVLEAAPSRPTAGAVAGPWIFPLSAKSRASLDRLAAALAVYVESAGTLLEDVAWTLANGRSHHRYRMAVVAGDTALLAAALRAQPSPSAGRPAIDVDRAVATRDLVDLATAYGAGAAVPFERLFDRPGRVVSLPVYPFDGTRYWNPLSRTTVASTGIPAAASDVGMAIRVEVSDWRLDQHRVNGAPMLPAAAVIELAAAALARRDGRPCAGLADLMWTRPVAGTGPFDLRLEQQGEAFRVALAGVEHATLAIAPLAAVPANLDVAAVRARCDRVVDGAGIYVTAEGRGIAYGPAFRLIDRLWSGDGEALARFVACPGLSARGAAVLDAAMQAAAGIGTGAGAPAGLFVPIALGAVRWLADAEPVWAHARAKRIDRDGAVFDIVLAAADGSPVAILERLVARGMVGNRAAPEADVTTRRLVPVWVDAPVAPRPVTDRTLVVVAPETAASRWDAAAPGVVLLAANRLERLPTVLAGRGQADVVVVLDAAPDLAELDALPLASAIDRINPQPALDLTLDVVRGLAGLPGLATLRLLVASSGPADAPGHRALAALLRCVAAENPNWSVRALALEGGEVRPEVILAAFPQARDAPGDVRVRDGAMQFRTLAAAPEGTPGVLRDGAICLITGGSGGIGLLLAEHLIRDHRARVVLLSRGTPAAAAIARVAALEATGGHVLVVQGDVADNRALQAALDRVRGAFGPVQAVFHLAGARRDGIAATKTSGDLAAVLRAKVAGTLTLDRLTRDDPLDLFCLFSSTAAEFPTFGQADYAAANGFLDGFAAWRAGAVAAGRRSGRTLSTAWPLWQDGGMAVPAGLVALLRREAGFVPLPADAAFVALDAALGVAAPVQIVLHGVGDVAAGLHRLGLAEAGRAEVPDAPDAPVVRTVVSAAGYVAGVLAEVARLPADRIEADIPFEEYGIDSMMITRLNAVLERDLGAVPKTLFFEYRTPREVAGYLERERAEALARLVGTSTRGGGPIPGPAAMVGPDTPGHDEGGTGHGEGGTGRDEGVAEPGLGSSQGRGEPEQASSHPMGVTALSDDAIAIVGIAGIYPGAEDLDAFWQLLHDGTDLIREIPEERWPLAGFYDPDRDNPSTSHAKWGGFIDGADRFDPRFFDMSPIEAESLDPQARKFLEVAWWALEDAGYGRHSLFAGDARPERRAGGVFVGLMHADYPLFAAEARAKGQLAITASGYWNAANRVSHFLDFRGPSVAVDTACSASLTAVHMAMQALRAGDCTVAIAGGVNLSLHPMKYWVLSKAGFSSSDGRCRSFGQGGDGYVPGEGAGAVVLKPLARARADGDRIHAVIRASAINHGGRTSGFTVPNPVAQGELIADALERAGVAPGSISYVEAHGTGTALGDPIEINGLRRAFGAAGCPLGSVKSNVGHLESAAGIVALTKVVLQMRHGMLAPSLHSAVLNPDMGIEGSGFRVVQVAEKWEAPEGQALRAGISSFGAGGANVHLIVEAPPLVAARADDGQPWPVLLSARSVAALRSLAGRLAERLGATDRTALVDVAGTLALGREAMRHRLGFVDADRTRVVARLKAFAEGIGAGVHHGEAASGTRAAPASLGLDAAVQAWVGGDAVDWRRFFPDGFCRTGLPLYPFERRRCWLTTRPDPAFNAPALNSTAFDATPKTDAIVLRSDDPLVVDHRVAGGLLAAGTLLLARAVACTGARAPFHLTDIAWTAPISVPVGGTTIAVTEDITSLARTLRLGNAMTLTLAADVPREAAADDLWGIVARCPTILPHDRVYALLAAAGVDYGPSYALLDTVHIGNGEAVGRIGDVASTEDLAPGVLDAAMQLCFALMDEGGEGLRPASAESLTVWLPLSMARFAHARRDAGGPGHLVAVITLLDGDGGLVARMDGLTLRGVRPRLDGDDAPVLRVLRPVWREVMARDPVVREGGTLIVGHDGDGGLGAALTAAAGQDAVLLTMRGQQAPGPERFKAWLTEMPRPVARIIFLGGWRPDEGTPADVATHERQRETATIALLGLAKAISDAGLAETGVALRVVTGNAQAVTDQETATPEPAAVTALAKAIGRDLPNIVVRLVDLDAGGWAREASRTGLVAAALGDAEAPADAELAWRRGTWLVKRLDPVTMVPAQAFRDGGRYVIAGAGGIGRALARHLAERHGSMVWLLGRRPPSPDEARMLTGTTRGSIVHRVADLANPVVLAAAVAEAAGGSRQLDGVFHTALVMHDGLIGDLAERDFRAVVAPKAAGAINLLAALDGIETGFLCAFSSSNAYTANRGQSAYAAASAFLDALVLARGGAMARVIDWGLWGEAGRMADAGSLAAMRRLGVWPIGNDEGFAALSAVLAGETRHVLALKLRDDLLVPLGVDAGQPNDQAATELDGFITASPPPGDLDPGRFAAVDAYARALLAETLARTPLLAPDGPAMARLAEAARTAAQAAPAMQAAALRHALLAAGPEAAPYVALLDRTVPALPDVVAGRVKATTLLFPDGSDRLVQAIYQGNRLIDWLQRLAAEAVAAEVRRRLTRHPATGVRVLEIGAGTGATSAFVLDALAPFGGRVTYVFTDIGPSFLVAARRRFEGRTGLETKLLDASRPGGPQGVPDGSVDVVLAANVVHATARISETLGHIGRMLRPDGLLVLKEATSTHDFNTLTFGLTPEWWGFDDPEVRLPGAPLLSRAGWAAALRAARFRDPRAAGLPGSDEVESVLLARGPLGERSSATVAADQRAPASGGPAGAVEAALLDVVADALHLSPNEVEPTGSFADYGADSIISVELVRRINARFGIELKTTALFNFATVRDLARFIEIEFADLLAAVPAPDRSVGDQREDETTSVDRRVAEAKGRTRRLRARIEARRQAAPVNAEADFFAREAGKAGAAEALDRGAAAAFDRGAGAPFNHRAAATLEQLLTRLEAGEIDVDEAMALEVVDDA